MINGTIDVSIFDCNILNINFLQLDMNIFVFITVEYWKALQKLIPIENPI